MDVCSVVLKSLRLEEPHQKKSSSYRLTMKILRFLEGQSHLLPAITALLRPPMHKIRPELFQYALESTKVQLIDFLYYLV